MFHSAPFRQQDEHTGLCHYFCSARSHLAKGTVAKLPAAPVPLTAVALAHDCVHSKEWGGVFFCFTQRHHISLQQQPCHQYPKSHNMREAEERTHVPVGRPQARGPFPRQGLGRNTLKWGVGFEAFWVLMYLVWGYFWKRSFFMLYGFCCTRITTTWFLFNFSS